VSEESLARGEVLVRWGSEVETAPVVWLWDKRIPRGKVSILDGLPGVAKTTLAEDVGARVTTGQKMPDGTDGPSGAVLFINYEDDAEDTLVPRFEAAGGDTKLLLLADSVRTPAGVDYLEIPTHIEFLEDVIVSEGVVLCVIDPLMAALAADVRSGEDKDVRRALRSLRSMAERTGAAVVCIRHLNKNTNVKDPILRGGGSIGIIGAARAGLIAGRDPEDQTRHVLAMSKMNLAPDGVPSLAYRVVEDPDWKVGAIEWLGEVNVQARDLLADSQPDVGPAVSEAVGILAEFLADGPRLATECKAFCKEAGISSRTLDRAKTAANVKARPKDNGTGNHWWWEIASPSEERQP
jgi:hypothetical protein